jgi:hypothetical protein
MNKRFDPVSRDPHEHRDGAWHCVPPDSQDDRPRRGMHWVLWAVIVFPCLLAAVVLAVRFCLGRPL